MSRVFEISERELMKKFRDVEMRRSEAVVRGVIAAMMLGAEVVAKDAPKDLGMLKKSTRGVPQDEGGYIISDAPHAGVIEMGSRPHWAPLKPLTEWARRHGANSPGEAERMGRAIQQKIAREGTKPTYFTFKKLPALRRILGVEVQREWELATDK